MIRQNEARRFAPPVPLDKSERIGKVVSLDKSKRFNEPVSINQESSSSLGIEQEDANNLPKDPSGKLLFKKRLGGGAFGDVYVAKQVFTPNSSDTRGRDVAVKIIKEELLKNNKELAGRFNREIKTLAKASERNPFVVTPHLLVNLEGGARGLVMDFIEKGNDLLQVIENPGLVESENNPENDKELFSKEQVENVLFQLAMGLTSLHENGHVHRDIKPENIIVDEESNVKLIDFGLAGIIDEKEKREAQKKLLEEAEPVPGDQTLDMLSEKLTQEGLVVGTPNYLAPESVAGDPADARSDLYALGLIAYEMRTGVHPIVEGRNLNALTAMLEQINKEPKPIHEVLGKSHPDTLDKMIMALLSKDPEDREAFLDENKNLVEIGTARQLAKAIKQDMVNHNPSLEGVNDFFEVFFKDVKPEKKSKRNTYSQQ